jgi:hypothetical protein
MHKRGHVTLMVLLVPAILILGMTGCGATAPANSSVPSVHPGAALSPSPSPPASVSPAFPLVAPAQTSGWAAYRDRHVAFAVPLPPGWRAGSFTSTTPGGPTYYIVQFFPPQSPVNPGVGASSMAPELIEITVVSAAPYISVAGDANWIPEADTVTIGNTQSTLYDRMSPSGEELDRIAEVRHGALQFAFNLHVASASASMNLDPAKVNSDTSLYLAMMQGFQLTTN